MGVLNENAPVKKKILRANHKDYVTKDLRKAIMKRSELETRFHRTKNPTDQLAYKKQRNFVSRLYKKERKRYYNGLDIRKITDNKKFWATMNPLFSGRSSSNHVNAIEINDKIITEDAEIAQNMNNYFANSVKNLDIQENRFLLQETRNFLDPIETIIRKYELHPSIKKIREKVYPSNFSFSEVSSHEIEKLLQNLNPKKSSTYNNIPPKYLKDNSDICGNITTQLVNDCIKDCDFPNRLKLADITPTHKCGETICQKNYRSSYLPSQKSMNK